MKQYFKKWLSLFLVTTLIVSMIPEYVGLAYSESKESQEPTDSEKEMISTDNLKELKDKRTPTSKTFTDEKGNYYKEIYAEKVHIEQNNQYKDISENLTSTGTGYVATDTTQLASKFPQSIKNDQSITYSKGSHKLVFELDSATKDEEKLRPSTASKTSTKENEIQYKNIYPQIDLRHITFNEEVKEDWIVNEYTGIHQFTYTLETDLNAKRLSDGSIGFFTNDAKEERIFTLPKPMMMDSNINDTKGEGVYSDKVQYQLTKLKENTYTLTLEANENWLKSKERVYPVYIDPSVTIDDLGDTYVSSKYPKANFNKQWDPTQGEYVLQTGYYDSTSGTNYPFIKFSIVGDLKGATIDSADLQTYVTHAYYASQKNGLWVDEAKGKWYADELTWNNKPSSTKITYTSVGRDEWAHFNVTNNVQAWVSGERSNYGFKFHTNGHGKTYWKKITAGESTKKAKVVIAYHYEKMATPTMTATADDAASKTGSVNVKWKSVYGATSYDLQMFDGKSYESVYKGTATSWNSKGKKVFPKSPYKTTSTYSTNQTGVELPLDPTGFYSVKAGSTVTSKEYKFRVIPIYPTGNGPTSSTVSKAIPVPAGEPELPTITTGSYPETDPVNKGRGWLNISWKKVANATGYKVRIWNGAKYENYTVGKDTLSVSTKGKKIWPTDDEIQAGKTDLHQVELDHSSSVGTGSELPIDPSTTYGNTSKRYSVRVIAMSAAGDSPSSDVNYGYMPLYAPKDVKITSNDDNLVQNKTSFDIEWKESNGAKYYDVILNDGSKDETIKVKGKTSYTTDAKYDNSKNYTATVQAYFDDDDTAPETEEDKISGKRGLSPKTSSNSIKPSQHLDLIGLEDYFTYEDDTFGNASSSVNVTTGNMALQFTDESLYTRSDLGYDFTRTYNSRSTATSALGKGWTFIGNETLSVLENGDVLYTDEDGTVHTFVIDGTQYHSPKGLYEKLSKVDDATYTLTDPNQFVQTFQLGKDNVFYITSYKDEYQNQIDFTRDEEDQLTTVSEAKGIEKQEKIQIEYSDGKISKVQFADHWTTYTYNGDLLVQTKMGSDKTTRTITENFTYNDNGQLIKYIDGENNQTVFSYTENELTIFDQQAEDEELSITNTYQFNEKENEFKSIATDDTETIYKRDKASGTHAVTQVTEPSETDNRTTFYELDSQYNMLKVTNPDGTTEENTYDLNGNILTSKSNEGTVTNTYNEKNQVVKSVAASGETTTNLYDGPSLVSSTVNDETTAYTYDSFGRVTKTTYPNGTFDTTTYDDDLYAVSSTDKKGNHTKTVYTIYGQQKEVTDADGHTTQYTYDPLYQDTLTSVKDGNGHSTAYTYDDNNNMSSLTDALGRTKTYNYNDNDQVTKVTMPQMTFQYEYDLNGELSQSLLPSGTATLYSYTEDDQVDTVQVTNRDGDVVASTHYQYDDLGNVSQVAQDDQVLKTYSYTDESNLLAKYDLKLFTQNYEYDDQERLTKRTTAYDNALTVQEQTNYKENGDDVDHVKYGVNDEVFHDYQYDQNTADNQNTITLNQDLLKQVAQFNDANLLASLTYTTKAQQPFEIAYDYTKNGNISKETIQGTATTYEYDGNNQLTKETFANGDANTYEYDAVGNRTAAHVNGKDFTFSYNDANQIEKKNDTNYQYDADGNLLQDEHFKYTYNEAQRLTSVQTLKGEVVASYTYDENGLRLTKTVGDTTHEYFYNDEVLNMEVVKKNGEVTQYRSYEWDGYTPLGLIVKEKEASGNYQTKTYQYITNQRGDVLSIRDQEDQEVGSYRYDAYGNVLSVEGDVARDNPIRYAGYYYDEETKNYYLQARYYNPENGAFLALDPHPGDDDEPLSQNGYTYANNNPVMNVDPNGERGQLALRVGQWVLKFGKFIFNKFKKKKKIKIYKRGNLEFTKTASKHMDEYDRYVPVLLLKKAIKTKAYKDPRGSKAKMYYTRIYVYKDRKRKYNLEVLYDKKTNTILHFKYSRNAMGPLSAIKK
ncbi:DNRLRE domain-containing protein [Rummeliibacillus sp. SL167]|uniref:DNRLRE domain-containing protein n=1 Tax=Rummeliibacillus sp. SL167 TaxID=2579792 RepID=UPI0011B36C20|nr:DNRLRE domain-containing protein [Rummeliibacillus sp. SL167]